MNLPNWYKIQSIFGGAPEMYRQNRAELRQSKYEEYIESGHSDKESKKMAHQWVDERMPL